MESVPEMKTVLVPGAATKRAMDNYNALLYDEFHFNLGLPFLTNTLLFFLLLTSDKNLRIKWSTKPLETKSVLQRRKISKLNQSKY